ncbi:MAG: type II toxin-antitoxin system HicB family antitoxin [Desulfovibrionaceae bacterium]|nr:type II toxin-antitoxin system HicB family antitoxin [Desulfovibrionaceae bacterium]MBF0514822.1 type II toxin-antitoxin system HicB family antitoxin [Desulfovibrionaceae bacterium]
MLTYNVELTLDDNGALLVTCPDLPEVATFGDDEQDALGYAVGAIEEVLAARMAYKKDIPLPTPLSKPVETGKLHPVRLSTQTGFKVLLYRAMRRKNVTKAELARRMGIARQSADRLLDLNHASRLDALDSAFLALGQEVAVELRERAA